MTTGKSDVGVAGSQRARYDMPNQAGPPFSPTPATTIHADKAPYIPPPAAAAAAPNEFELLGFQALAPKSERWKDDRGAVMGTKTDWDAGAPGVRKRFQKKQQEEEERQAEARRKKDPKQLDSMLRSIGVEDNDVRSFVVSMMCDEDETDSEMISDLLSSWMGAEEIEALLVGWAD